VLETVRAGALDADGILDQLAPSDAAESSTRRWWNMFLNSASTPPEAVDEITSHGPVDIRGLLGSVHAPTLVLHRTHDRFTDVGAGRYMAARLPRSRLVERPGEDHLPFAGDQEGILTATEEFLTGTTRGAEQNRAVLTVMFTDMVGSTELASRLGDRRWRRLVEDHNELVRSALARFGDKEIDTAGDGFLITFDGPARAIRAAAAVRAALAEQGISIRVGLHTGECELVDGKVREIAVHVAARVMTHAEGGEILCSRTVKDLVAGSGFLFIDRGTHVLKGVPDDWQLYKVELT
jgi:class 3 adenylate cyclase